MIGVGGACSAIVPSSLGILRLDRLKSQDDVGIYVNSPANECVYCVRATAAGRF